MKSQLPNLEWVHRARSLDKSRTTLFAVHATETHLAATDGHRLHVAPNAQGSFVKAEGPELRALQPGNWIIGKYLGDVASLEPGIHYPNYEKVIPKADYGWTVMDQERFMRICEAATHLHRYDFSAGLIALPTNDGNGMACFSPRYLAQALSGMPLAEGSVYLHVKVDAPMSLRQPETDRLAVLMPVRVGFDKENESWRLLQVGDAIAPNTKADIEESA